MYNYADSSRASLVARLHARTELFRRQVHGPEDLAAFAAAVTASEDQAKRYEVIYCCEYLGFLDENERRVGCLLHPAQNGGSDLRGASFYGQELCEGHFCPSYHYLSPAEQAALVGLLDDWYLYGLCVTDIDFVKSYFCILSDRVGEMPRPEAFHHGPLREAAHAFFSLKTDWPFRSASVRRFGKYYFDGSLYMIDHIDYAALGCERSRFDTFFLCLASTFCTAADVREAEALIEAHLAASVAAYRKG